MAKIQEEINPYIGPIPFEKTYKSRFFGREEATEKLLPMIYANKVVLIYAQSGSGKTSLINARLEELFEDEGFKIFKILRFNTNIEKPTNPNNIFTYITALSLFDSETKSSEIENINLTGLLKYLDDNISSKPFIIIFDQFEEIFTTNLDRWKDRKLFIKQIQEVCDQYPKSRILFAIREEFLGRFNSFSKIWKKPPSNFYLEMLNRDEALKAIIGPVQQTDRKYGKGEAEKIVDELMKMKIEGQEIEKSSEAIERDFDEKKGEFVEPVQLQIVCKSLWNSLKADEKNITFGHLAKMGGVEKVLEDYYQNAIKNALMDSPDKEDNIRNWFEKELITPINTRGIFLQDKIGEVGITETIVNSLSHLYLIRTEDRANARWITLSHDRFIDPIRKSNRRWVEEQCILAEEKLKCEQEEQRERIKNIKKQVYIYFSLALAFIIPACLFVVFFWLPSIEGSSYERSLKYLYEGKQYFEDGRYQQAEESLLSSLSKNQIAEASFYLAKTYGKLNKPEQAIQQFRSTVQVDSTYAEAYLELGVLLIQNNNIEAGYKRIKKFFELNKSRPRSVLDSDLYTLLVLHHFNSQITSADSSKRCNALEKAIVLTHQHIPYAPMGNSIQHGFDSWGFVSHIFQEANVLTNQKIISLQDLKYLNTTINPMPMDLILFPLFNNIILFYLGDFFGEKLCIGVGLTAFVDIIDISQINYPQSYYHCDYY